MPFLSQLISVAVNNVVANVKHLSYIKELQKTKLNIRKRHEAVLWYCTESPIGASAGHLSRAAMALMETNTWKSVHGYFRGTAASSDMGRECSHDSRPQ